jgi:hypothetical protein
MSIEAVALTFIATTQAVAQAVALVALARRPPLGKR